MKPSTANTASPVALMWPRNGAEHYHMRLEPSNTAAPGNLVVWRARLQLMQTWATVLPAPKRGRAALYCINVPFPDPRAAMARRDATADASVWLWVRAGIPLEALRLAPLQIPQGCRVSIRPVLQAFCVRRCRGRTSSEWFSFAKLDITAPPS